MHDKEHICADILKAPLLINALFHDILKYL
jgi:hypothetical protein